METLVFNVDGMTCGGCSSSLEKKLVEQIGVLKVTASHTEKTATVIFDPSLIEQKQLIVAIEDVGFDVLT